METSNTQRVSDVQTFEAKVEYTGKVEKAWDVSELFECAIRIVDAYEAAQSEGRELLKDEGSHGHVACGSLLSLWGLSHRTGDNIT